MRYAVAALLAAHGLLHLLGFLKPFGLARLEGMTGRSLVPLSGAAASAVGVAWLAAAVVLTGAGALRLLELKGWWWLTAFGVVLSQALIVLMWHDAKVGTLANVLLAVAVVVAAAQARFAGRVEAEARALLRAVPAGAGDVVGLADLEPLPAPIRRWLGAAGVVGRPRVRTVRLLQTGQMRLGRNSGWLNVAAEQYFDVPGAAFVWSVKTKLFDVLPLLGRDRLAGGHGNMLIVAAGLVTVANGTGAKIDQGTQLRYLAELVWFPSAALEPYVRWQPLDDHRARATLTKDGTTVSADFTIDDRGRFESLTAQRWYSPPGGTPSLQTWVIPARAWRRFDGVEVPSQGDAVWKLPDGDLDYFRWRISHLEHDVPSTFEAQPDRPPAPATQGLHAPQAAHE
ncbi:MAG: hypothetical protein JNK82_12370 [Myxococcaceae bacterium]|nr:hypothetical protein [Myxococcaceae bacterium]